MMSFTFDLSICALLWPHCLLLHRPQALQSHAMAAEGSSPHKQLQFSGDNHRASLQNMELWVNFDTWQKNKVKYTAFHYFQPFNIILWHTLCFSSWELQDKMIYIVSPPQVSSLTSLLVLSVLPPPALLAQHPGGAIPLGRKNVGGGQPTQECALVKVAAEDREDSR